MELAEILGKLSDALMRLDSSRPVEKTYQPGIGPFTEARLVKEAFALLSVSDDRLCGAGPVRYAGSRATCDLVIADLWAIEFKLLRPFGDNGKPAEHWIENALFPYSGNSSLIGDCLKLHGSKFAERKAVSFIAFEHLEPRLNLEVVIRSFELICKEVMSIQLSERLHFSKEPLVHPYHQRFHIFGWEIN